MSTISAADVAKLRGITGSGMMDCKKALEETNGDFQAAIDVLRKKGQKVASNRAERTAGEGVVIAKVSADAKKGVIVVLNSESDFVAKNDKFVDFVVEIADIALAHHPANIDALKALNMKDGHSIQENITNQIGVIGEKIELSNYQTIEAGFIQAYIHPGNKIASLVGFNNVANEHIAKDVAMQVAAMAPVSLDKDGVSQETINREIEIGKELARQEGKAEDMLEKIAQGRLNKFFKESTLMNQEFIKDNKLTVKQYVQNSDKELNVTGFCRFSLQV